MIARAIGAAPPATEYLKSTLSRVPSAYSLMRRGAHKSAQTSKAAIVEARKMEAKLRTELRSITSQGSTGDHSDRASTGRKRSFIPSATEVPCVSWVRDHAKSRSAELPGTGGSSSTTTMPAAATVPADIVDVLIEVKSSEAVEQPVDDETADLETMQLELAEIEAKLAAAKEEAAKEEALRT